MKTLYWYILLFVSLIFSTVAIDPIFALDDSEVATEETGGASAMENMKSLGGMIVSGGTLNVLFFGVLGLFSLWSATVVLERMVNLRREKLLPKTFPSQLANATKLPPNMEKLRSICDNSNVPASRILRAGIIRAGRPLSDVEKAMEDAAAREMALLRGKIRPLNVVGNIAPLVGLLGTVVGMIMAFQISSEQGLGKAEQLAEGIYLALMTTAAGLTIAIPCLLFASWFQARGERYMCDVADCLTNALPYFASMEGSPLSTERKKMSPAVQEELTARERFLRGETLEPSNG